MDPSRAEGEFINVPGDYGKSWMVQMENFDVLILNKVADRRFSTAIKTKAEIIVYYRELRSNCISSSSRFKLLNNTLHIDPNFIVRRGIRQLVTQLFVDCKHHEGISAIDLFEALNSLSLGLVILGDLSPVELMEAIIKIRKTSTQTRILIFSSESGSIYGKHWLKLGAAAFMPRNSKEDELVKTIEASGTGCKKSMDKKYNLVMSRKTKYPFLQHNPLLMLSLREIMITDLLYEGQRTKDIAERLGLAMATVSTVKRRVFCKLNVTGMPEFVVKVSNLKDVRWR